MAKKSNSSTNETSNSKRSNIKPNPNTQTAPTEKMPDSVNYVCVICDADVPFANREQHIGGRKHQQFASFLNAWRQAFDNYQTSSGKKSENAIVILLTAELKERKQWRCDPCDEVLTTKMIADAHQALRKYQEEIRKGWESFRENCRFVDGLQKGVIPTTREMIFYVRSKKNGAEVVE